MTGFLDDLPELGTPGERPQQPRRRANPDFAPFMRVRCPRCGSGNCPVYNSNHIPVRYHRCHDCGKTFKSVEVNYKSADNE